MAGPYLAASSYLNAAPLCYSFVQGAQRDRCHFLSDAAPARCAQLLVDSTADGALIPVIEYQRIPQLAVVPDVCVASRGTVRSVVLASRVPIERIASVALDTASRTSAALIQIILARFYELRDVTFQQAAPRIEEMLASNDAALLIGDPAMLIDRSPLFVYDLAEEWGKHTGLPFVFAFWAIRPESPVWSEPENTVDFAAAKLEGLAHVDEIASSYSASLGLPREELLEYLTENISYDLDERALSALNLYYDFAAEAGLIEEVRQLEYWTVS